MNIINLPPVREVMSKQKGRFVKFFLKLINAILREIYNMEIIIGVKNITI
jgi:hypothetical protein